MCRPTADASAQLLQSPGQAQPRALVGSQSLPVLQSVAQAHAEAGELVRDCGAGDENTKSAFSSLMLCSFPCSHRCASLISLVVFNLEAHCSLGLFLSLSADLSPPLAPSQA